MDRIIVQSIVARHRESPVKEAAFDHFTLGPGEERDAAMLIGSPNWTLYCLDFDRRQALLVELSDNTDLESATFAYDTQFRLAKRAAVIPLADLGTLAAFRTPPHNTVMVFSMGRCGSTLVSRMLGAIPEVWSLSEPDALTNLVRNRHRMSEGEAERLITATIRMSWTPPPGPARSTFAIKPRSQAVFQIDSYASALPDAKFLFLHREPVGWAQSYFRLTQKLGLAISPTRQEDLLNMWNALSNKADLALLHRLAPSSSTDLSTEQVFAALWWLFIDRWHAIQRNGPVCEGLSYGDIVSDPPESARHLLHACGLNLSFVPTALAALQQDSQADSPIGRQTPSRGFNDEERARFQAALAQHPMYRASGLTP